MQVVTDCHIVWLDQQDLDHDGNFAVELKYAVSYSLHSFTNLSICQLFIEYHLNTKGLLLFVIHERCFDQSFRLWLKRLSPDLTIFIYILASKYRLNWRSTSYIRDVFHLYENEVIIMKLQMDLQNYLNQRWSSGVCLFNQQARQMALNQISDDHAQFMWFQLLVKVLLRMPTTAQSKNDLLEQSFLVYCGNKSQEKAIRDFHQSYQAKEAIERYTSAGFIFRLFNQACRTDDIDLLFSFRFYLHDLFSQLENLHRQQVENGRLNQIKQVYRSAIISKDESAMLNEQTDKKKLIWVKSFVSTTLDIDVAKRFLIENPAINEEAVLQEIHLDQCEQRFRVPYADIHEISHMPGELEILLGIGMVFEMKSFEKEPGGRFWNMKLEMVDYDDRIREDLRVYLEEDIAEQTSVAILSTFLNHMGDYKKAIRYNELFLKDASISDDDKALVYNNLGYSYQKMKESTNALRCLDESIDLYNKMKTNENRTNLNRQLARPYNNKGLVYQNLGDYPLALENIQKSLDFRVDDPTLSEQERKQLSLDRSLSLENLCLVYVDMSNYRLALSNELQVLEIRQACLPSNHYLLSQCYNNLAFAYLRLNECQKAFEFLNKAMSIQVQCLPEDHPHLSKMYNNHGQVYYSQACYESALVNFQKALSIRRRGRVSDPSGEAILLSNIASVFRNQNNFDQALEYYLEALPIIQRFKPRHPDVVRALTNVGLAYRDKENRPMALVYFQEALKFCQTHLDPNHEMTASSYLAVASVLPVEEIHLAIEYLQHVIDIHYHCELTNHKNMIISYQQLGDCYSKQDQHALALKYYSEAISRVREGKFSSTDPLWIVLHVKIALEYLHLDNYDQAVEEYTEALSHVTEESSKMLIVQRNLDQGRQRILEYDVYSTINQMIQSIENSGL